LARSLYLDEFAGSIHDDVHVHGGGDVFKIIQVEHWFSANDSNAYRRHRAEQRILRQLSLGRELAHRESESDVAAGNRRRPGATISLQDIAIDPNRALANFFQINRGSHRSA